VFDKPDPLEGPYFEETIYVTPSRLVPRTLEVITRTTADAAAALGLVEGPIHAETCCCGARIPRLRIVLCRLVAFRATRCRSGREQAVSHRVSDFRRDVLHSTVALPKPAPSACHVSLTAGLKDIFCREGARGEISTSRAAKGPEPSSTRVPHMERWKTD